MCGRYTIRHNADQIVMRFMATATDGAERLVPRYNVCPMQKVPVIVERLGDSGERVRTLEAMGWGLVPFWAGDRAIGSKMINARCETVAEKPAYGRLLKRQRCIVPSDGFYEWKAPPIAKAPKLPFHFRLRSDDLYGFAGLWDTWSKGEDGTLTTCTIITTTPNDIVAPVHNRMPVILRPDHEAEWLGPETDTLSLLAMLTAYPQDLMEAVPVSTLVNKSGYEDAAMVERVALPENSA